MQCGAAVIAADNSSQPEVIGSAGVLARSGDANHWSATITHLVENPARIDELREAALIQARQFSWKDCAQRLRSALESATPAGRRPTRKNLAIIPVPSANPAGFSPESTRIFEAVCRATRATIFFETDRAADLPPLPIASGWYEKSLLDRVRPILGNPPLLYLVDAMENIEPLLRDLSSNPGNLAFCNDEVVATDAELRTALRLASVVTCHSEKLHRRLLAIAGEETRGRVHRVDHVSFYES